MARKSDKEIQDALNDANKGVGGVKSTEPAFQRYRETFLRDVDFKDLKKYSPEQLIRGARTTEELFFIGQYLNEEWGQNHWWWKEYHERRVHLAHLPSLYGKYIDPATGKERGLWGVPVDPEVYVRSSSSGPQKYAVNRRLFTRLGTWEQITGKRKLFSVVDTPRGPVIKGWKGLKPPTLPSNMPSNALIFDLETTGLLGQDKTSIISLGFTDSLKNQPEGIYASFDRNIKYDPVIEKRIIPEWERAVAKSGVSVGTERELLEKFIARVESSSKTHALMGYNINQFDIPLALQRAEKYGLQGRLESALKKSTVVDVAELAKSFISKQMGGSLIGWEQSALGYNPLGWQLEVVAKSLGFKATGEMAAHEAKTDVLMTEYVWNKLKDQSKWKQVAKDSFNAEKLLAGIKQNRGYSPAVVSKSMGMFNFSRELLDEEAKHLRSLPEHLAATFGAPKGVAAAEAKVAKAAKRFGLSNALSYSASFVGLNMILPGSFWQNAFSSVTWEAARIGAQKAGVKGWKTWAAAVGGSLIGNAIWMGAEAASSGPSDVAVTASGFSGKDDAYNLIQGLGESGLAPQTRHELTEFGSGWQGSRELPTSLMGVQIDPRVLAFRRDVIEDKDELAALEADIKKKQAAAQANLGDFAPGDLGPISAPVAGLARNKNLREVNLSDYKITVEDADTLILGKKGLFGFLSKDISVRLSGVDAPEVAGHKDDPMADVRIWQEQAGGKWSSEQYKKLIEEQENLRLIVDTKNKTYGRSLGVLVGDEGKNLAIESVRRGLVTALPFGKSSEDVVSRRAIAQAEEEAKATEAGIWQFARYKAIAEANKQLGQPITYNVLTELTKVGRNLNLGAYGSFLESLGTQQRELTSYEVETASRLGRSLKKTHGKARFSQRFSGKKEAYNTVEALRHDGGLSEEVRSDLTAFGSGFDAVKSYLQTESINEAKSKFLSGKQKRYALEKKSRFSGRDDQYNIIEGLLHTGLARDIRQALTEFGSGWDPVRAMARAIYKNLDEQEALDAFRRSSMFKEAVSTALKGEGKELGKGVAGAVKGYSAEIQHGIKGIPTKFDFAIKEANRGEFLKEHLKVSKASDLERLILEKKYTGLENAMIEAEVGALSKQAHDLPSLYGTGKEFGLSDDTILMEQFKGTSLDKLQRELSPDEIKDLYSSVERMHGSGITHGDLHRANIMLTDEGKIGIIDLGMSKRLSDPRVNKHLWGKIQRPLQKTARTELGREVGEEEFSRMLDLSNIYAGSLLLKGNKQEARPYIQVINQLLMTGDDSLIEAKASQLFRVQNQIDQMSQGLLKPDIQHVGLIPKKVGSSSNIVPDIQDKTPINIDKTPVFSQPLAEAEPMVESMSFASAEPAVESFSFASAEPIIESLPFRSNIKKQVSAISNLDNAKSIPIPLVTEKIPDPQRARRMQKFRESSRSAVGIGHRSAHNAGRKHSKFGSVV